MFMFFRKNIAFIHIHDCMNEQVHESLHRCMNVSGLNQRYYEFTWTSHEAFIFIYPFGDRVGQNLSDLSI